MKPLGLPNGCPELALRNPPPLVPSSLMTSWLAAGPPGMSWVAPSSVLATVNPLRFWMTPWLTSTSAPMIEMGSRMRVIDRVRSTQKLPIVFDRRRTRPRTRATAMAMPTAADTKFCTASAVICVKWLIVISPA